MSHEESDHEVAPSVCKSVSRMHFRQRLLSFFVTFCLVVSYLPTSAFADCLLEDNPVGTSDVAIGTAIPPDDVDPGPEHIFLDPEGEEPPDSTPPFLSDGELFDAPVFSDTNASSAPENPSSSENPSDEIDTPTSDAPHIPSDTFLDIENQDPIEDSAHTGDAGIPPDTSYTPDQPVGDGIFSSDVIINSPSVKNPDENSSNVSASTAEGNPNDTDATAASAEDDAIAAQADELPLDPSTSPLITIGEANQYVVGVDVRLYENSGATTPLPPVLDDPTSTFYATIDISLSSEAARTALNFKYPIPSNVTVDDAKLGQKIVYLDSTGKDMLTYELTETEILFSIDPEWALANPSGIKASFLLGLKLDEGAVKPGENITLSFPGYARPFDITAGNNAITGSKDAWSSYDASTGRTVVNYRVPFSSVMNDSDVVFTDTLGENLSFVEGSFKLDEQPISGAVHTEGQTATITVPSVSSGQHVLTYQAVVDQSFIDSLPEDANAQIGLDNRITWVSQGDPDGGTADHTVSINKSMVSKGNGTYDPQTRIVTWTVRINTGSARQVMDGYVFTDKLDDGMTYQGTATITNDTTHEQQSVAIPEDSSSFVYTFPAHAGTDSYTITYQTVLADDIAPGSNLKNLATVTPPPNIDGPTGESSGTVTVPYLDKATVDKTVLYDADTQIATWTIEIHPDGLTVPFDLDDQMTFDNEWTCKNITFNEDAVLSIGDRILTEGTDYTIKASMSWIGGREVPTGFTVSFLESPLMKDSLAANETITVTYTSTDAAVPGRYYNTSVVKKNSIELGKDTATYSVIETDLTRKSADTPVYDAAYTNPDGTSGAWLITWTVYANVPSGWTQRIDSLQCGAIDLQGNPLVITDIPSDGQTYVEGSARYVARSDWYTAGGSGEPTVSVDAESGTVRFTIPTDDERFKREDGTWPVLVQLFYQTAVPATESAAVIPVENTASTEAGSLDLGSNSASTTVVHSGLQKSGSMLVGTPYLEYVIEVNSAGADLVPNTDTLVLEDVLDPCLTFLNLSFEGSKEAQEVSSYTVTSLGDEGTKLVVTVPDETPLEVHYRVRLNGIPGETVHITNSVSLNGNAELSSTAQNSFIVQDAGASVEGDHGTMTLIKVDASDPTILLPGAHFDLYRVFLQQWDLDYGSNDTAHAAQNIAKVADGVTNEDGVLTFEYVTPPNEPMRGMVYDVVYFYVETEAPTFEAADGSTITYEIDPSRHYFMLKNDEQAFNRQIQRALSHGVITSASQVYTQNQATVPNVRTGEPALSIFKTDPAGTQLVGAHLQILQGATVVAEWTTAGEPHTLAPGLLTPGETYTLHEVAAPDGYLPADDVVFQAPEAGVSRAVTMIDAPAPAKKPKPTAVSVPLVGSKSIEGRTFQEGDAFTFAVEPVGDAPVFSAASVTVEPTEGTQVAVDFGTATFSEPGTYSYQVLEQRGEAPGITYDQTCYTVTVVVTETDSHAFEAAVSIEANGVDQSALSWTNTYTEDAPYEAFGSLHLQGDKVLTGRDLKDGEFTFTLAGEDGAPMPVAGDEVHNSAGGSVDFGEIEYSLADLGGEDSATFTYTVTESGKAPGVTNDPESVKQISVTVTDDGQGSLTVVANQDASPDASSFTFTNTYEAAPTELPLVGSKSIDGRDFRAGDTFTFEVEPVGDAPAFSQASTTVEPTAGSQTAVDFGTATFTEEGTYSYEVSERAGDATGVSYDTTVYELTVLVTDNGEGDLEATSSIAWEGDQGRDPLSWTNTYQPLSVDPVLAGTKVLEGRDFQEGDSFSFTVEPQNGAPAFVDASGQPRQTVTIAPTEGNRFAFALGSVTFTEVGTYTYTISEVPGDAAGMGYSTAVHTLVITVTDDNGQLKAQTSVDGLVPEEADYVGLTWVNTYEQPVVETELALAGTKVLEGRDFQEGDAFEFEVVPQGNAPAFEIPHVVIEPTQGASQAIDFGTAVFTEPGTYTYVVHELSGNDAALTYDTTDRVLVVTVADDGANGLQAVVSLDGADPVLASEVHLTWVNTYEQPVVEAELSLAGTKVLEGRDFQEGDAFTFAVELVADAPAFAFPTVIIEPTSGSQAEVDFGTATFTEPGSYRYEVRELLGEAAGISYDPTLYMLTVVVTADEKTGALQAQPALTAEGEQVAELTWTNEYACAPVEVAFEVTKQLEGRDLEANEFAFELLDAEGEPVVDAQGAPLVATNALDGSVMFPALAFEAAGTYAYQVREIVPSEHPKGMLYDAKVVKIEVEVTEDVQRAQLAATVTYDGDATATFTNKVTGIASFAKVDEQGEALPGATLQLLDQDGTLVEEWTTTEEPHVVAGLTPGATYVLHEAAAPEGYALASDITFTVTTTGEMIELSMVDAQTPVDDQPEQPAKPEQPTKPDQPAKPEEKIAQTGDATSGELPATLAAGGGALALAAAALLVRRQRGGMGC